MIRFWSKVEITSLHGCWEWTAGKNNEYGMFWLDRDRRAHAVAYELVRGPIPHGLELDHLCRNKGCVNPFHLEAVTHQENMRRALVKTHCSKGHARTPENLSGSHCRVCETANKKEYALHHKEEKREYDRQHYALNREKILARKKEAYRARIQ